MTRKDRLPCRESIKEFAVRVLGSSRAAPGLCEAARLYQRRRQVADSVQRLSEAFRTAQEAHERVAWIRRQRRELALIAEAGGRDPGRREAALEVLEEESLADLAELEKVTSEGRRGRVIATQDPMAWLASQVADLFVALDLPIREDPVGIFANTVGACHLAAGYPAAERGLASAIRNEARRRSQARKAAA